MVAPSGENNSAAAASKTVPQNLTARFASELEALGGTITLCTSQDLTSRLLSLLQDRQIRRIQSWEAGFLPAGLLDEIRLAGIEVSHQPEPDAQAGLTGALAGIAETGTLVLTGGAGKPMTASLLAPLHIAILQASEIYENLPQAFRLQEVQRASAAVLVSGPSRTADIEMTLTIGVHGPGELHVMCITMPDRKMAKHN